MDLQEAKKFLSVTVSKTRYSAREIRFLSFNIDTDYVMELLINQQGKCALTGWNLEFTRGGKWDGKNPRGCTMDRIDSTKGYIRGNIQLVCGLPNVSKGNMPNDEFIAMCKSIAKMG
jgi:hypothetical protein